MVKVCVKCAPKHQHAPIALFGSNLLPFLNAVVVTHREESRHRCYFIQCDTPSVHTLFNIRDFYII